MFDSVPEGMLLLDSERRIILANQVARKYLEELSDASVGKVITHLGKELIENLLALPNPGTAWSMVEFKDSRRVFAIAARPLEEGPPAGGWVLVLYEATKEVEQEQRLQNQQRLATVGQLAAGIAHDFNNILAVITRYSEALINNPEMASRPRYLQTINEQAQHASNLIRQILDFSRASVIERSPLDLLPSLNTVVNTLQRTFPESIALYLEAEDRMNQVEADATRLQQVIINLAVNARHAIPDGGALHLTLSHLSIPAPDSRLGELAPGNWIRLTVRDTGLGISPEVLPRIFEPFFTTKPAGRGTGLGLAQVYGIVKQHGGEIEVASQVTVGTCFAIYLLVARAGKSSRVEEAVPRPKPRAAGHVLLLVEDDAATRVTIEDSLCSFGYEVISAATGDEALAAFHTHKDKISLVLSDVVMPTMSGFELYETLRAAKDDVKVAFVSGYPYDEKLRDVISEGSVVWLEKPFTIEGLLNTVHGP